MFLLAAPPLVVADDFGDDPAFEELVDEFVWRGAGVGPANGVDLPPLPEVDVPYDEVSSLFFFLLRLHVASSGWVVHVMLVSR